jgi:CheY-like chemotaxis protein
MSIDDKLKSKTLRVLVVEQSASMRQLIAEVLRGLGFSNVASMASIIDAHNYMETEGVDWLILPLYANENPNGLQTVRMIASFPELIGTKVSLLLDERDEWAIAKSFEFGLFTYHKRSANRDGLVAEFQDLLKSLEDHQWDITKTSLAYLRRYLKSSKQYQDLLALEKNVLQIFPGNSENLISLAEAQQLSGEPKKALATLSQADLLCPEKKSDIQALREQILGTHPEASQHGAGLSHAQNILGLKNVVIIDHDDATRSAIRTIISELGCSTIHDFADGESASKWMDHAREPDLIVMEWRIPKVSGPLLLQRVRSRGFMHTPIIVLSSLIKTSDMPLIRELGVANLALKPLEKATFLKAVIWTIQQDRIPSDIHALENKIRMLLNCKELKAVEVLLTKYFNNSAAQGSRKSIFKAELAYAKEQYREARDLAIEAVKHAGESLFALNILGKCLMTMRDYDSALKCFKKAQSISPMNLERLVIMAEVQAELGDIDEAKDSLNKAKDIDPENRVVSEGMARVAIASGASSDAQTALASLDSNINLIRYLNNKAVAHAKCGFAVEGLEIYQKTLAAIPRKEHELIAVVIYNAALAKIRSSDQKGAMDDLEKLLSGKASRVSKKAESLKRRLEEAMKEGRDFTLPESDPAIPSTSSQEASAQSTPDAAASSLINSMLSLSPGELCCYLLFKSTAFEVPELKKALANSPKFQRRKSLQRDESFTGSSGIKATG